MGHIANYNRAVRAAIAVLEEYSIVEAPIQFDNIFNTLRMEIRLCTYTDFMRFTGKTLSETIEIFDTELGACLYKPQSEQYVIFYNDHKQEAFCRFTIAHELGHYFLGHHRMAQALLLNRSFLTKSEYDEYEKEANVFARNLLSPVPLARYLRKVSLEGQIIGNISMAFNITSLAARVRVNYLTRDEKDYDERMEQVASAIQMKCQPTCFSCQTVSLINAKYCITCGSTRLSWLNFHNPLPPSISIDQTGRFYHCPRCGNTERGYAYPDYCKICGLPYANRCSGDPQSRLKRRHLNTSNARFCARCGTQTKYNSIGFYPTMEVVEEMVYTDGVEYDSNTFRVKRCPRCNNEEFGAQAIHCRICGLDLYNQCEGEVQEDDFGRLFYTNKHANPSNARFCEICGRPTEYSNQGILKSFREYQDSMESPYMSSEEYAAAFDVLNEEQDDDSDYYDDIELPFE